MACHWVSAWKLSDFRGPLSSPENADARSCGTLIGTRAELDPAAQPLRFRVDDEDDRFDDDFRETGDFAVLADDLDLDCTRYPAGRTHIEAVFQLQTADLPAIELLVGRIGAGAGAPERNALVFSEAQLFPGQSYELSGCMASAPIRHDVICFAAGTMIDTPRGPLPVETLRAGDKVLTRDAGALPVLWAGCRRLSANDLRIAPRLAPVRIRAGAFGPCQPETDLLVSPQHHVALSSRGSAAQPDLLVPARALCDGKDVTIDPGRTGITYCHLLLDSHHLVCANGLWAETLFTGPQAVAVLCPDQLVEIERLHPGLMDRPLPPVRPVLTVAESRAMGILAA